MSERDFLERAVGRDRVARPRLAEIGEGARDHVALDEIAAHVPAGPQLGRGFDALGDHADAKHMCQLDDAGDEQALARVVLQRGDEEAVDLQDAGLVLVEHTQLRIALAEIVERDAETAISCPADQVAQVVLGESLVNLRDFEADVPRRQAVHLHRRNGGVQHVLGGRQVAGIDIEKQLGLLGGLHAREFGDGFPAQQGFEFGKTVDAMCVVEHVARGAKAQLLYLPQQRLVPVYLAGIDVDDRLERIVERRFRLGHEQRQALRAPPGGGDPIAGFTHFRRLCSLFRMGIGCLILGCIARRGRERTRKVKPPRDGCREICRFGQIFSELA